MNPPALDGLFNSREPKFYLYKTLEGHAESVRSVVFSDDEHFVANVDFFATFMEATGLPQPDGLDGRSLVPLLKGGKQDGRDFMFTQIDYTIGGPAKPMRCIQAIATGRVFDEQYLGSLVQRGFEGTLVAFPVALAGDHFSAILAASSTLGLCSHIPNSTIACLSAMSCAGNMSG